MSDNNNCAGTCLKVYIVVNASTLNPTEVQWRNFFQQAATKPLATAIRQAALASQNQIAASKRSLNASALLKNTLVVFEIATDFIPAIIQVVNDQAIIRGCAGTDKQQFVCVLTKELQEAAVDLGLTVLQSQQITMTAVAYGERMQAITDVQTYLVANAGIWYA